MRECNLNVNKVGCNCTYEPCPRKGICCDCLKYHRDYGEMPACFFPPEIERTYDRSIERFISCYKQGRR
jgi:hypothetical protein